MRLVDCFTEPMAYAACLVTASQPPPFEAARPAVEAMLASGRSRAAELGMEPADVEDAFFAACAYVDEAVLGSRWDGREQWIHQPLQKVYCNTINAGEEFFQRLGKRLGGDSDEIKSFKDLTREAGAVFDGLGRAQPGEAESLEIAGERAEQPPQEGTKAVLEVYCACLNLGFTGRYFTPSGYSELKKLQARTIKAIFGERARQETPPRTKLFPWLYPAEPQQHGLRRVFWRGLDAVDVALVLVPAVTAAALYFMYNHLLSKSLSGFLGFGP